jgi:hypothetical protein
VRYGDKVQCYTCTHSKVGRIWGSRDRRGEEDWDDMHDIFST